MLTLTIKHSDGDREIQLVAENMNELIDVKLPKWLPIETEDMPLIRKTKRYKPDPVGVEKAEIESGWYYYK